MSAHTKLLKVTVTSSSRGRRAKWEKRNEKNKLKKNKRMKKMISRRRILIRREKKK